MEKPLSVPKYRSVIGASSVWISVIRDDVFKVVNKNQKHHVLRRIFLFDRRREQLVFCIVVDHCFCQNLIGLETARRSELCVHKGRDLVHI